MRVVRANTIGSIDDYAMAECGMPTVGAGEVLIRVAACGLGYVDALLALGGYQVKPATPFTPGQEISGVIEEVGGEVTGLRAGDRVIGTIFGGGLAEFASVPQSAVHKMPPNMTFAQAACFKINYLTAAHGLIDRAQLKASDRLLVLGAAGGVGSAAVQVGRQLGANVIAAASSEDKRAFAERIGAHLSVDTEPDGWRDRLKKVCGGNGPDVIFDPVCGPLFEPAFRSLQWGGRHVVIGFVGGAIPALPANLPLIKGSALVGADVRQFQIFEPERSAELMRVLLAWVEAGLFSIPVGPRFAFQDFRNALNHALSGQASGKLVVEVGDPGPEER